MTTFKQLLAQTAFSVLDEKQQRAVFETQTKMLENSLQEIRQKIANLEELIRTQEFVYNPCIESKDKLAEMKKMEQMMVEEMERRQAIR